MIHRFWKSVVQRSPVFSRIAADIYAFPRKIPPASRNGSDSDVHRFRIDRINCHGGSDVRLPRRQALHRGNLPGLSPVTGNRHHGGSRPACINRHRIGRRDLIIHPLMSETGIWLKRFSAIFGNVPGMIHQRYDKMVSSGQNKRPFHHDLGKPGWYKPSFFRRQNSA